MNRGGKKVSILNVLCAGAARGLVRALQDRFTEETDATVRGSFGAVGAIKEALLAGESCDVMIGSAAVIDELVCSSELRGDLLGNLGYVYTGLSIRADAIVPVISTPQALKTSLLAADSYYVADPFRATAGIHFASVLKRLGIYDTVADRIRGFPNGATAMRELAATKGPDLVGCTQITEINYTEGVRLVGRLPPPFELATLYTAAVTSESVQPELAARFVTLFAGAESLPLRSKEGFGPV